MFAAVAEVPFAEHAGGVTGGFELLGDGDFVERKLGDVVNGTQRPRLPLESLDAADSVDAGPRCRTVRS